MHIRQAQTPNEIDSNALLKTFQHTTSNIKHLLSCQPRVTVT